MNISVVRVSKQKREKNLSLFHENLSFQKKTLYNVFHLFGDVKRYRSNLHNGLSLVKSSKEIKYALAEAEIVSFALLKTTVLVVVFDLSFFLNYSVKMEMFSIKFHKDFSVPKCFISNQINLPLPICINLN